MAKVLEFQFQHHSVQWIYRVYFLWDWLVWSPCNPRDSQDSFLAPKFESINSSALSLLYGYIHIYSQVAQTVKNPPAMWETCVWSLGWEVGKMPWRRAWQPTLVFLPGEGESSWTEEPSRLQSMGSQRVRYDWACNETYIHNCRPSHKWKHGWKTKVLKLGLSWKWVRLELEGRKERICSMRNGVRIDLNKSTASLSTRGGNGQAPKLHF